MSSTLLDDDEYPYSSKPPIVLTPREYRPRLQQRIAWRVLFGWAVRLALAGLVLLAIVTLPIAIIGYRARSQAATIAELENRGCIIGYSNKIDAASLRGVLCDFFGSEYFDDVTFVSATELPRPEGAPAICRLCGQFKKLETFSIQSDDFRLEQIANWPHFDNLTSLTISCSKITDDDLRRISRLPNLTNLQITSANVTGVGLQHLSRLPQLESLTVGSSRLDGSGPTIEVGFPNLRWLRIHNSPLVTDQTVINLGPLPELIQAEFSDTPLGDGAVAHVATGGHLGYANLASTRITDKCFEYLARSTQPWMIIDVSDTNVTDDGIQKLQGYQELSLLNLNGTKVTGKGFHDALHGRDLTLNVDHTLLDDRGLQDILKIVDLTHLTANGTQITGTAFDILGELDSIESLELRETKLTNEGLNTLARAKAHQLILSDSPLDDNGLMLFVSNDFITSLWVNNTRVTAAGVCDFYEARKKRLDAANKKESLELECDFPDAVEPYLPRDEFGNISLDGNQPEITPPSEPEQPATSEQPPPEPPQP